MPKVTHVKSARRALPAYGIAVGDSYYHWGTKSGGRFVKRYSKTAPTRSQLTNSEFKGTLYDIFDNQIGNAQTPDDLREAAEMLRTLGSEQQDKYDNMPEGLQQGDTGQMLEARASGCESAADEIDQIAEDLENKIAEIEQNKADYEAADEDDEDAEEEDYEGQLDDALSEAISEAQEKENDCDGY